MLAMNFIVVPSNVSAPFDHLYGDRAAPKTGGVELLDGHGDDGGAGAAGDGLGRGGEEERRPTVGGAVGGQRLEVPVLALHHPHLHEVQRMDRERYGTLEVDALEGGVVGGDCGNVAVVEPL